MVVTSPLRTSASSALACRVIELLVAPGGVLTVRDFGLSRGVSPA